MKHICLLFCLLLGLSCMANAATPPETPFIRINTALHSAKIMDIAADASGDLLVTASFDKTVKLWDAASGKLLKTFRPPVGAGLEGALLAVALSPDGTTIATAGWTGFSWDKTFSVYLFDVKTGELSKRLTGFHQSVLRLSFSPDGKRLAVGFNNSGGVRLFHLAESKKNLDDRTFKGNCFGLTFDQQGNLLAANDQGVIKLYRHDGTTAYAVQTENGKQIYDVRFSPDGKLFAVVYNDYHGVEVRKASDGQIEYLLQQPKGKFFSVAWSADGRYLMAAGGNRAEDSRKLLVKWSVETRALDELIVLPTKNGITRLLPLIGGEMAFVSRMTGFGILNNESKVSSGAGRNNKGKKHQRGPASAFEGDLLFFHELSTADFQKNHDLFRISPDALSVFFSYERYGLAPARFDLKSRKLVIANPNEAGLLPHRFTADGIDVQNWEDSTQPRLNRRPLQGFFSHEFSQSLAVRHDEKGFVLGSNYYIRHYARTGKLLWKHRIPHVAWDVALSADDRILVATHDDSSIRWYRMTDGKELYALYLHPDKKRWLFWSPDGYFDHGAGSENLIGFQINRGVDQSSTMVGAERMYDLLYRPDLIDKVIAGEDVSAYLNRLKTRPQSDSFEKTTEAVDLKKQAEEKVRRQLAVKVRADQEQASRLKAEAERKAQQQAAAEKMAKEQTEQERVRLERERAEQAKQDAARKTSPVDDLPVLDEPDDEPQAQEQTVLASLVKPATLPPRVRFITPSGSSAHRDLAIAIELCDAGGGIGNLTLFLNNTPIIFEQNGRGLVARSKQSGSDACQQFERVITLAPGTNVISLMALNAANSIESDRDRITVKFTAPELAKPRLHLLTIAVNRYRDGDLRLNYAVNDAEGLIHLVQEKGQTLFSGIETYRLHDELVTRAGLEGVFAKISAKAERGDVFLLFMAGHGLTDELDGRYYFLPVDFRYTGLESVTRQGISMEDFKHYISSVRAMKALFLIDTCNSGGFSDGMASRGVTEKTALNKLARSVGRATITASSKNQVALEGYQGHGVFSYTLLEGLKGNAANKNGEITINNLATFIEETLPELTYKKWGYEQIPQKSLIGSDFPIGMR